MIEIDWIWGFAGGLLIGLAAAFFLIVNGRIMGASGIVAPLTDGTAGNTRSERLWFIAGLLSLPLIAAWVSGGSQTHLTSAPAVLIVGGFLVGVGSRLANGCTSGHGVCGISRLSVRGIVATIVYIGAGAVAVLLFKHLLGVI